MRDKCKEIQWGKAIVLASKFLLIYSIFLNVAVAEDASGKSAFTVIFVVILVILLFSIGGNKDEEDDDEYY